MLEVRATNMWGQVQCVLRGEFVEEDDSDTPLDESTESAGTTSLDEQEIEAWPGEGEFEVQMKTETPPEAEGGWPNLTALGWTNGSESTNQPLTDLDRARALSMADRVRLVSLLESLCEYYADTPAGQKAVQLHEKLSADPQFMAEITRHKDNAEAERQYQLASLYLKARKYDKAAKLCQEIIDNWPNSDWAKQARKDLEVAQSVPQLQGSRTR
jgi:tetratricopeptide (TPR) repeat protein